MYKTSKVLFEEAEENARSCSNEIKKYKEVGYNPHQIDFKAEAILFDSMYENFMRLKVRNRHDEAKMQELALSLSDFLDALKTIMEARVYLSVDMREDAYETMGKKIYEPRIAIQEITKSVKEMLGSDYLNPGTLIPEESKTVSAKSLYSLE